jgi:hypothetical protein
MQSGVSEVSKLIISLDPTLVYALVALYIFITVIEIINIIVIEIFDYLTGAENISA